MSDFAQAFEQILHKLGAARRSALLGVGPSALSNYMKRTEIPRDKLALIRSALQERGWRFDLDRLQLVPINADTKKRVLLIITGGIAAYKGLDLARRLMDRGFAVRGVMTESAQQFITPLSLSALTGEKVYTELFSLTDEAEMGLQLARDTDLVLVAPATANFDKLSHGLADCQPQPYVWQQTHRNAGPGDEPKYVASPCHAGQYGHAYEPRRACRLAGQRGYRLW